MVMSCFILASFIVGALFAMIGGHGAETTAGLLAGAEQGVSLAVSIAGPLCLWSGIGALMEKAGILRPVSRLLSPLLHRLYPQSRTDPELEDALCANVCANLLGLGNAATPMGIRAAGRLRDPDRPTTATDPLCRLVVMNTASIQLLPTTVAAVRSTLGADAPFDILPCVWVSSILSVSAGLLAAAGLRRVWRE